MDKNEKFVITINRQFGTGGHEIGVEIARRLNVKVLDKQILDSVAKCRGLSDEAIERLEIRDKSWKDDFTAFYRNYMNVHEYHVGDRELTSRRLFNEQADIIRYIAEDESCVIIGRCAFDIFRDHPNALKIFVHSPMDTRVKRIVDRYGVSSADAKALVVDNDYTRELYTKMFTGTEWYDARNYDLTLDVSKFGINGAVDYIMGLVE